MALIDRRVSYSGTALFTRRKPLSVTLGIGTTVHDDEGRVNTAELDDCQRDWGLCAELCREYGTRAGGSIFCSSGTGRKSPIGCCSSLRSCGHDPEAARPEEPGCMEARKGRSVMLTDGLTVAHLCST